MKTRILSLIGVLLCLLVLPARAGLTPNGNPTGPATVGSADGYTVSLKPNPAVFMPQGSCPWLMPALKVAAQPYNNANNIWNYTFATLQGSFSLNSYRAWADTAPSISLGSATFTGGASAGNGGAAFVINYAPQGTDPTNDLKWIQVIGANQTFGRGATYGTNVGGLNAYLDNSANSGTGAGVDPYYGWLSDFDTANGKGFLDRTSFPLADFVGLDWEAQAFLAKETSTVAAGVTTHNVTIYDGVWWGFTIVPEPGSATLLIIAGGLLVWKRRLTA